jgi:hypothetical protein
VRVRIRDTETRESVSKVQVKVIGSDNATFLSSETDLRGVSVAEGVHGEVTAVARKGTAQYAFYRGTGYVGEAPSPSPTNAAAKEPQLRQDAAKPGASEALDKNLKDLNSSNQQRQIDRLEQRYGGERTKGAQAGGFR